MTRITRSDVEHVARLARLALSDEEIERFTGQLEVILEHAADVSALDTSHVDRGASTRRDRLDGRAVRL